METQCITCIEANIKRAVVPKLRTSELAKAFGDHFHMDIWGPARKQALGGYNYTLTLVDDATRWTQIYLLKTKDNAYGAYIKWAELLYTQHNIRIKTLQSDNDSVFLSTQFNEFLNTQGTTRKLTVHDTPQQNGVAE